MARELHIDIVIEEIVPKLPTKSLNRFKLVSKSFDAKISSQGLIKRHLRDSLSSDANRLLILPNIDGVRCFDIDSLDSHPIFIPYVSAFNCRRRDNSYYFYIGACNGLLLIGRCLVPSCWFCQYEYDFVVVNPCTGDHINVPIMETKRYTLDGSVSFGFGYDSIHDDYKVLGFIKCSLDHDCFFLIFVYSLRTKLWRYFGTDFSATEKTLPLRKAVLIDDRYLNWLVWDRIQAKCQICCFDVCTECWIRDVPLPDYYEAPSPRFFDSIQMPEVVDLRVLDGYLSVVTRNYRNDCSDVWVMKEYGVQQSWVKLLGVLDKSITRTLNYAPIAYRRGSRSEILLWGIRDSYSKYPLSWYNIKDRQRRMAEVHDVCRVNSTIDIWLLDIENPSKGYHWANGYVDRLLEQAVHEGIAYVRDVDVCTGSLFEIPGGSTRMQIVEDVWLVRQRWLGKCANILCLAFFLLVLLLAY